MRPNRKGRSVKRALVAAAIAAATLATLILVSSQTAMADVIWVSGHL